MIHEKYDEHSFGELQMRIVRFCLLLAVVLTLFGCLLSAAATTVDEVDGDIDPDEYVEQLDSGDPEGEIEYNEPIPVWVPGASTRTWELGPGAPEIVYEVIQVDGRNLFCETRYANTSKPMTFCK